MFRFLRWLLGAGPTKLAPNTNDRLASRMNQGDFHSGPAGYTPNAPYAETQYGSSFDQEADWADDEH